VRGREDGLLQLREDGGRVGVHLEPI
jgi:hypothetical protein